MNVYFFIIVSIFHHIDFFNVQKKTKVILIAWWSVDEDLPIFSLLYSVYTSTTDLCQYIANTDQVLPRLFLCCFLNRLKTHSHILMNRLSRNWTISVIIFLTGQEKDRRKIVKYHHKPKTKSQHTRHPIFVQFYANRLV